MTKTLVLIADLHVGSTVGLCPPKATLDDGGSYEISTGQRWLWQSWGKFVDRVRGLSDPILIMAGDIIDCDIRQRSYQLITRNVTTVIKIATDILDPLIKMCTKTYVLRGTAAHVGLSAEYEEQIASDFGAVQNPETEKSSWYRLFLKVEDVKVMVSHHGKGLGQEPNASAARMAARIQLNCTDYYNICPDLAVFAHNHLWADSHDAHRTRVVYLPSWCLASEYAFRLGTIQPANIGAAIITVDKNNYNIEKVQFNVREALWTRA